MNLSGDDCSSLSVQKFDGEVRTESKRTELCCYQTYPTDFVQSMGTMALYIEILRILTGMVMALFLSGVT